MIRSLLRLTVAAAALWGTGFLVRPDGGPDDPASTIVAGAAWWLGAAVSAARQHPGWVPYLLGGVAVMAVVRTLAGLFAGSAQRDPQRLYSVDQKREMIRLCGGRCEHKTWWLPRCRGAAEHADHIVPWSKGGATSVSNGQMLCAYHNLLKSNWMPSRTYIVRLERRRRGYFPDGANPLVESRIGVPPRTPRPRQMGRSTQPGFR